MIRDVQYMYIYIYIWNKPCIVLVPLNSDKCVKQDLALLSTSFVLPENLLRDFQLSAGSLRCAKTSQRRRHCCGGLGVLLEGALQSDIALTCEAGSDHIRRDGCNSWYSHQVYAMQNLLRSHAWSFGSFPMIAQVDL